jgi:hypothetical protein
MSTSEFELEMIAFSDRLGKEADAANSWFKNMTETWRTRDGRRLVGMELNQLGQELLKWIANNQIDIAEAVLREMETALSDNLLPTEDVREFSVEVLDGVIQAIYVRRQRQSDAPELELTLLSLMGDETKLLWIPLLSSLG